MVTTNKRYGMAKGTLLVLVLGLASALLFVAACGGDSATATRAPTPTSEPTESAEAPDSNAPSGQAGTQESEPAGEDAVPTPNVFKRIASTEVSVSTERATEQVVSVVRGEPGISPSPSTISSLSTIQYSPNQQVGIWVTGRGEVTTTPDLAMLSVGVEAKAVTVEQARNQAAQAMNQMLQALKARGIQDRDIQTRFFNISPEYTFNDRLRRQELVGYVVNNQVSVTIRDIESVGQTIDEVATAGGDLVRIQGVSFTVEDTEALESQARERAVKALMAKAQQIAELAGVQLGKPVFLSESGGFQPVVDRFAARAFTELAAAPATAISGGELTVATTIQGVFSIIE